MFLRCNPVGPEYFPGEVPTTPRASERQWCTQAPGVCVSKMSISIFIAVYGRRSLERKNSKTPTKIVEIEGPDRQTKS